MMILGYMCINMKTGTITEIRYVVEFGGQKETDRKKEYSDDKQKASDLFREKQKQGFHVDAYEVVTTTVVTKLS